MPSNRKIEWTAEQKKQFIEYVNKGYSERKLQKIFGINRGTIRRYKRLWNLKSPNTRPLVMNLEADNDPQREHITRITLIFGGYCILAVPAVSAPP